MIQALTPIFFGSWPLPVDLWGGDSVIRDINQFEKKQYDLLVIGGGINGASIANLSARAGIKTALLEKGDFASGTSSKSTKLIHGGLRYLENLEVDLVYESLKERKVQLAVAPHLVQPLEFLIPVYQGDRRPLWMMRLGVFLYDLIAGPYRIKRHKALNATEVLRLEPGLQRKGLKGGVVYYDAQMDDARLCLENVLSASEAGAHAANYAEVKEYLKENGRVIGVKARDHIGNRNFEVHAKKVVVAVGPWTDKLLKLDDLRAPQKVRTTQGIHIVYKDKLSGRALFVPSQSDKRIFFVIPWLGHSLIGTTDTDYVGDPDRVKVSPDDVEYLMRETRRVFPELDMSPRKILSTFSGLRPLVRKGGSASKVSRKHLFYETPSGLIFVVGGKYTTYRAVAESCLKKIFKRKTWPFALCDRGKPPGSMDDVARSFNLEPETVHSLFGIYGGRVQDVLAMIAKEPSLKEKVSFDPPVIKAQLPYAVQKEMACTVEDITDRRLSLGYLGPVPESVLAAIREFL
ncbi:MAG TPA: glycerol-3-phosphate dehydrogenase/oxidase [Candidatus Omnitrophota bacterium]|nr:glycerol-3-phosphate dehydrogenase/oxidase [Candidatus Omnitrophota bacterium]